MACVFKHTSIITLAIFAFVFTSCGGDKPDDNNDITTSDTSSVNITGKAISAQNVFNSIPARAEIITLIGDSKIEYNPDFLNNPEVASKYSLENSRALNLGAYGSDLSVSGAFDQTQESMIFLKCVNILAKNLGVSNSFDEKMVDRMSVNKSNRDSTLEIVSQSFKSADKYLKDNSRPGTSSLIVAGAWVEGIYLAINTAKETKSEPIVKEIYGQSESLKYLIQLLEQSKIPEDATYILTDLKRLKTVFDAKKDNVFTVSSLSNLDKASIELRTKIISGK